MSKMNRDSWTALFLLLFCSVFFKATFDIRDLGFETLGAEVWPRIILGILTILSLVYFIQSIAKPIKTPDLPFSISQWFHTYSNGLWCFFLFYIFLESLPYLGMLLGGVLFVFCLLCILGDRTLHATVLHFGIAIACIGSMWSIFTFGLKVMLPQGEIFSVW